jgi:hypothetical protein
MLEYQRPCHGHRGHRSCQGEGSDDRDLIGGGEVDDSGAHGDVELPWRARVDDRVAARLLFELLPVDALGEGQHLETVGHLWPAPRVDEGHLVGQGDGRPGAGVVPEVGRDVLRLDRLADHADDVE